MILPFNRNSNLFNTVVNRSAWSTSQSTNPSLIIAVLTEVNPDLEPCCNVLDYLKMYQHGFALLLQNKLYAVCRLYRPTLYWKFKCIKVRGCIYLLRFYYRLAGLHPNLWAITFIIGPQKDIVVLKLFQKLKTQKEYRLNELY